MSLDSGKVFLKLDIITWLGKSAYVIMSLPKIGVHKVPLWKRGIQGDFQALIKIPPPPL